MPTFDTPTPVTAVLDIPAGRIRLVAADRADTTIEVLPADAGKSRDVKAAEQTEVGCEGGVLRIAVPSQNRVLGPSGAVEVTVHLPAGSHVEANSASAELRGVGRLGDVTLDAAQAAVTLDEAASARLTVKAGDIRIGRLGGPARISSQQGDITVAEAVRGTLTLSTGQGDLCVGAAPGVSASLDAGTAYGRISNALKNTGGTAELVIHATTAHGDITARSL